MTNLTRTSSLLETMKYCSGTLPWRLGSPPLWARELYACMEKMVDLKTLGPHTVRPSKNFFPHVQQGSTWIQYKYNWEKLSCADHLWVLVTSLIIANEYCSIGNEYSSISMQTYTDKFSISCDLQILNCIPEPINHTKEIHLYEPSLTDFADNLYTWHSLFYPPLLKHC